MKSVLKSVAIPLVQALVVLLFLSWLAAGKAQAAIEVHQFDNPAAAEALGQPDGCAALPQVSEPGDR